MAYATLIPIINEMLLAINAYVFGYFRKNILRCNEIRTVPKDKQSITKHGRICNAKKPKILSNFFLDNLQ